MAYQYGQCLLTHSEERSTMDIFDLSEIVAEDDEAVEQPAANARSVPAVRSAVLSDLQERIDHWLRLSMSWLP